MLATLNLEALDKGAGEMAAVHEQQQGAREPPISILEKGSWQCWALGPCQLCALSLHCC